ncbi:hypothetical protein B0T09DRAFT_248803, partial [Sordaria sp. MPI-SDFR-AT-0083]
MCHKLQQLHSVCGHVTKRELPCDIAAYTPKRYKNRLRWSLPVQAGRVPAEYVFRHRDSKNDRAAGSGLPRQELAVLQQVMKIAGIDMGSSGAAFRLGNAKEMRRKTLEWAEEGDSARRRNEMEQEVEARKRTEEEKQRQKGRLEQERIRQERRQQGRVQQQMQERLEKQRLKEQKVESQRKRLEEQRFDEEEFEERRARKERRLKVKRWLEQQRSLEENNAFKKNIIKEETREKIRKSGKNKKKTTVEIKGMEGKTLIKCEHGKSKMGVKVSITPHSTQHHGSHSSARHRREEDSGDVDSLEGKPDVYRSRAFSDLPVHPPASTPISKKRKTEKQEAGKVEEKEPEEKSTFQRRYQQPHIQDIGFPDFSEPAIRQQSNPVAHRYPKLLSSKLGPNLEIPPSGSEAKAPTPLGTSADVTSKRSLGRPEDSTREANVVHQSDTDKKAPTTDTKRQETPSKPNHNQDLVQVQNNNQNISTVQAKRNSTQKLSAPKPLKEVFPTQPPTAPPVHPTVVKNGNSASTPDHSIKAPLPDPHPRNNIPKATNPERNPAPQQTSHLPRSPQALRLNPSPFVPNAAKHSETLVGRPFLSIPSLPVQAPRPKPFQPTPD